MQKRTCEIDDYQPGLILDLYKSQSEIVFVYENQENVYQKQSVDVEENITYQQKCKKMQQVEAKIYDQMVQEISMMINLESNNEKYMNTNEVLLIQINKGNTKKSQYTKQMMSILQDYKDNQLIGKLAHFINKYNNKIQFNKQNVKSIKQFLLKNNEDTPKMDLFINIFMEVSHHKDNGMLYMFNSLNNINKFLKFLIEQPEYREKYLDVVNRKLISIYTKCSNKKVPQLKDLQDVITLKSYQKDLKIILESAKVTTINQLANYLRQLPQKFPIYFKQVLQCKQMILKILKEKSKSVQVQEDFLISMKNNPNRQINEIYEFVTENLISRNQKSRLDAILKTKSSDYKQQKRVQKKTPKNRSNKNKFTSLPLELQVQQKQQASRIEIEKFTDETLTDFKTFTIVKENQGVTSIFEGEFEAIHPLILKYSNNRFFFGSSDEGNQD